MVLLPVANLQERAAAGQSVEAGADADLVDAGMRWYWSDVVLTACHAVSMPPDSPVLFAGRRAILQAFRDSGIGDISASIVAEDIVTPHDWQADFGLQHGAVFGMCAAPAPPHVTRHDIALVV